MTKINPHMLIELRTNPHYFLYMPEPVGTLPVSEVNKLLPQCLRSGQLEQMASGWNFPGDHILHIGSQRTMTRAQWLKFYSAYRRHIRNAYLDSDTFQYRSSQS